MEPSKKRLNPVKYVSYNVEDQRQHPFYPWEWPEKPWSRIHLDHAGPFMGQLFLIVIDAYSKRIEVYPTSSTSATATI